MQQYAVVITTGTPNTADYEECINLTTKASCCCISPLLWRRAAVLPSPCQPGTEAGLPTASSRFPARSPVRASLQPGTVQFPASPCPSIDLCGKVWSILLSADTTAGANWESDVATFAQNVTIPACP